MTPFLTTHICFAADDLAAMTGLLNRAQSAGWGRTYLSAADLYELLSLAQVQANTRLWWDAAGGLVGFALVDHYSNLHFVLDPAVSGPEMEEEVVGWSLECVRRAAGRDDGPVTLDASCDEDDARRLAFLQRHGFRPLPVRSLHLTRSLQLPIPAPAIAPGYVTRPATGIDEVEALVALHRAAFGTVQMTVTERLAMMGGTHHDPALDLVAVAPDGTLAAYCLCQIDPDENRRTGRRDGYADPIATHPGHRRRGLARALLLTGMRLLRDRGMDFARLGTSSENLPMQRAAASAGFQVESCKVWFSRPAAVRLGAEGGLDASDPSWK